MHLHVSPMVFAQWPPMPGSRLPTRVRPVCVSFKSKMCIANLPDDLGLVGPASYLALLSSKSIALRGAMLKPQQ